MIFRIVTTTAAEGKEEYCEILTPIRCLLKEAQPGTPGCFSVYSPKEIIVFLNRENYQFKV